VLDLDLTMKRRHPDAPISVALRDVRCPRCNGHGTPRITALRNANPAIDPPFSGRNFLIESPNWRLNSWRGPKLGSGQ